MLSRVFGLGTVAQPVFARGLGTVAKQQREHLLLKIYAPFSKLDKNSPEYKELALSGKVWEDYHQPADSEKQGYTRLQQVCTQYFVQAEFGVGLLTHNSRNMPAFFKRSTSSGSL